jgi:uncharacterized membrane protein
MEKVMRTLIVVGLVVVAGAGQGLTAGEKRAAILEIYNVPGFTNAQGHGISPTGTISGNYQATGLGNHGFYFDGTEYRTLDVPGFATFYVRTSPTGDAVVAAGAPGTGRLGYFFSHRTAEFRPLPPPPGAANLTPWGINAQGDIVGSITTPAPHAFLLRNGDLSDIHVPGAASSAALDINSQGDVVGRYVAGGVRRMFLRTRPGDYQTIEVPGAVATGLVGEPGGINDKGEIVGVQIDSQNRTKGFLLDAGGFQVIDFPNTDWVVPADIDNHGNIVGTLRITNSGRTSAFLLRR